MKILLAHAIKEEKIDIRIQNAEVVYVETFYGKTRAALHLMHAICENQPDMVINFGTAGTINHEVGDIIVCNRFIDRDLCKVSLEGLKSEIVLDRIDIPKLLGKNDLHFLEGTCNTGDSFITEIADFEGDCIDMEAFAEADVCREMNIPFVSVKYITDVVGKNSVQAWLDKIADARKALTEFFR